MADAGVDVDKIWSAKLGFVTTDLLRFANVHMRISQCLESMARANKGRLTHARRNHQPFRDDSSSLAMASTSPTGMRLLDFQNNSHPMFIRAFAD